MGVELRPLNVLCNIQCLYCYQHPQRDAGNIPRSYDMAKMKSAIEAEGSPFTLFGGEPLLLPLDDLEDLWSWGFERYGRNEVQTNGTLITEEHIRLFHQYKVHVGFSIDGPGELNDIRWHTDLARTRESTARSLAALKRLCTEGLRPALIITLHRVNACAERLPMLLAWVRELIGEGVKHFRLHLLESESEAIRQQYGLTAEENTQVLMQFLELNREFPRADFHLFGEMRQLLMGEDRQISCIWNACDPYTTSAVRGIEGQGQRSNCGRTNKDGVDFVKTSTPGYERYISLFYTPQASGGCSGCRFFLMCKGQCPGTGIGGDWRNRTEHCEVWKSLFEFLENELVKEGKSPLSLSDSLPEIEKRSIELWTSARRVSLSALTAEQSPARQKPQAGQMAGGLVQLTAACS